MRCFRKLLGISYRDHITNDAVRDRIRQAIGPYDDTLTTVKKRKLKWFGHVSRSSGLAKTILQGTVQGGRRRGRQKKRWENNIAEWTGLKFCHAVREADNKINWGERVATSVAPQRTVTDYGIGADAGAGASAGAGTLHHASALTVNTVEPRLTVISVIRSP